MLLLLLLLLLLLTTVSNQLRAAEQALLSGDEDRLYEALKAMGVQNLQPQNKGWYLKQLLADQENKEQVRRDPAHLDTPPQRKRSPEPSRAMTFRNARMSIY